MKRQHQTKYFLIFTTFLFCACDINNPSQNQLSSEELKLRLSEYATFLSSNYKQYDILTFETENGETEELRIETSYTTVAIITNIESEDDDKYNKENNITDSYGTGVYLVSRKTQDSQIGINISILNTGETTQTVDISCKRNVQKVSDVNIYDIPKPNENQLLLQDKSGWVLLEQNIGIIQMADTLGHTWKLNNIPL